MKKVLGIVVSVTAMIFLIFYYGMKVNESRYSKFTSNGYIISKQYNEDGNYIKSEKYYFNDGTKYKKNYNSEIVFENANKEESKVEVNSFIHYDSGDIAVLKKSAILGLDDINKDSTIKYYNMYENMMLQKSGTTYSIKNAKNKLEFSNLLIKISDNKYILIGNNIVLKIGENNKKIDNGYYEIEYIDGNIVRIENNEVSYQNIPNNVEIALDNNVIINIGNKYVMKNTDRILNLNEMTIDSSDNIEIAVEEEKEEEETTEEEKKKSNPIGGMSNGSVNGNMTNDDEEEVNENVKVSEPQFIISEMNITSNKFQAYVQVKDDSNILADDINMKIIEVDTNKIVYQNKEVQGTMNLEVEVENLNPETNYLFIVSSSYTKNGNLYTRDFVQKNFLTENVGVTITKDYFTSDMLAFVAEKKYYSTIKSFDATLLNENGKVIKSLNVNFDISDQSNMIFDNLSSNSTYVLRISNYLYEDSIITDSYINDKIYKTLKRKPTMGNGSFVIDKKNSAFTLKMNNLKDIDNGIISYRYEIYDARNLEETIQVVEKNNISSVDIRVDGINIQRGTPYVFKVIALFDDNEKKYEYETDFIGAMKMDGVKFPTINFEEQEVTFERIKGNIVITDDGNTISLDENSKIIVVYTDSISASKTFTTSGNLSIPFNVNGLRKNETYVISIYAKVDLQDGNTPIDVCFIGSTTVKTKDTNPMYLSYKVDQTDTSSAFKINARLGSYNGNDTELEANTMSGLIFNLYEGTSTSGTLVKPVRKTDRNTMDDYVSTLKDEYYNSEFTITPELFNLKNQDLKAQYYTIEVQKAYDYTSHENRIDIMNNIITVKIVGYVPSLPEDPEDAMDVKIIRNKDVDDLHRDDLDEDTIIGYKVKGIYDNSNRYARKVTYKLYDKVTNNLIEMKNYDVPSDGSIGYVPFYLKDGTAFNTKDQEFRRGNSYYFTYSIALDLNDDGISESTYPSNPGVILKSKNATPEKQKPYVYMYPSNSTINSFTWKYKISDIDNAIYENKFNYSINGTAKTPISFTKSQNYSSITFNGLASGYLDIGLNEALTKDNNAIKLERIIYQRFYGMLSPSAVNYKIYDGVNRVIFSFLDYQTNPMYDKIAGARIVFTAGSKSVVKDYLSIKEGNIIVDYADLESLMGLEITPKIYLYYDSGITGYDTGASITALQMLDNNTSDYSGKYYYMNTNTTLQTEYVPNNSLFDIGLNISESKLTLTSKKTSAIQVLGITEEKNGITNNYEVLFPKVIKETIANPQDGSTFRFDKIIPCISLLNEKNVLEISPTLVGVKMKINLYGNGGSRIKDEKVYVSIYETDEKGTASKIVNTTEFTIDELGNVIYIDGLIPKRNYYAKIYAYILSGEEYVQEQLYDIDFQSNTKNYYFKTLGDVGLSNLVTKYVATSYKNRQLKLTYNLEQIVGYDRIEYEIYKVTKNSNGTTTETKIDVPIDNDYIFSSKMLKYINIPPGCGVIADQSYKIIIRPYSILEIDGTTESIELTPNNSEVFVFNKIADPYVSISSQVATENSLEFKVNFYDTGKAVVNDSYTIEFYDESGNNITPTSYKSIRYSTNASRKFVLSNLQQNVKYEIRVKYSVNLLNKADSIIQRQRIYSSNLIENNGISIGNFSLVTDVNDTSRIRLLFYDSYKLTDIQKIRYSIYSSNGYSFDKEEDFIPITIKLEEGIVYYYYTLNTVLPATGQYYLQLQFIKDEKVVVEQSIEYNYIK